LNRLLIDTSVLLELMIAEVASQPRDRPIYNKLRKLVQWLDSSPRRDAVVDGIRSRFGALELSAGTLIEIDRHGQQALIPRNRREAELEWLERFWEAYARLPRRFAFQDGQPMPVVVRPFTWTSPQDEILRFGPIDAHCLELTRADSKLWLLTSDDALYARALASTRRALHITALLD
jgi:hypothetical protein